MSVHTAAADVLLLLMSYLLGAFPAGLLVGKMVKGIDVRDYGSGNIGASNVWRTMGPLWGIGVFLFDFCKGYIPTLLTSRMHTAAQDSISHSISPWLVVGVGMAAILGHNFSPFLRFKGGKGVATSLGVVYGLSPEAAALGFAVWLVCLAVTRYISVSSIVAAVVTSVALLALHRDLPHALFALLVALFVVVKHRANMARVTAGTEPKVSFRRRKRPDALPQTVPEETSHPEALQ